MRIGRKAVAVLVLALGLTGVLLATLSGTAGSTPKSDTAVVTSVSGTGNRVQPDGMGYDGMGYDGMGYDGLVTAGMGYDAAHR